MAQAGSKDGLAGIKLHSNKNNALKGAAAWAASWRGQHTRHLTPSPPAHAARPRAAAIAAAHAGVMGELGTAAWARRAAALLAAVLVLCWALRGSHECAATQHATTRPPTRDACEGLWAADHVACDDFAAPVGHCHVALAPFFGASATGTCAWSVLGAPPSRDTRGEAGPASGTDKGWGANWSHRRAGAARNVGSVHGA